MRDDIEKYVNQVSEIGFPALIERFVLRNGKPYAPMPHIGRKRKDKECFKNAAEYVLSERTSPKARYVEGLARGPVCGLLIHHAWVEIDGQAMDPTWRDAERSEYYGFAFEKNMLIDQLIQNKVYGLLDIGIINTKLIFQLDPMLQNIIADMQNKAIVSQE